MSEISTRRRAVAGIASFSLALLPATALAKNKNELTYFGSTPAESRQVVAQNDMNTIIKRGIMKIERQIPTLQSVGKTHQESEILSGKPITQTIINVVPSDNNGGVYTFTYAEGIVTPTSDGLPVELGIDAQTSTGETTDISIVRQGKNWGIQSTYTNTKIGPQKLSGTTSAHGKHQLSPDLVSNGLSQFDQIVADAQNLTTVPTYLPPRE